MYCPLYCVTVSDPQMFTEIYFLHSHGPWSAKCLLYHSVRKEERKCRAEKSEKKKKKEKSFPRLSCEFYLCLIQKLHASHSRNGVLLVFR